MRTTTGLLLLYLTAHNVIINAQDSLQGIYLSLDNFKQNKISYLPIPHKKYKIVLNETFYKPTIKIISGDSVFTLNKDSIFGFRDKENTFYRFYGKTIYKIMNPNETILLYSLNTLGGYKNTQTIVRYFFSTDNNPMVQALTLWNMKNAFPQNSVFHELLDLYFRNDDELTNYDSFYKMYKLNRVLHFSKKLIQKNITNSDEQN